MLAARSLSCAHPGAPGDAPLVGPVDLTVGAGEWLAIVGGNGSGKTALLLTLAGLGLLAFYLKRTHLLADGKSPVEMADRLFPTFLGNQLPAGCAGLVISAFLCDAIQTLEAGVNAITAVVSKDLMPKQSDQAEHSPAHVVEHEDGA